MQPWYRLPSHDVYGKGSVAMFRISGQVRILYFFPFYLTNCDSENVPPPSTYSCSRPVKIVVYRWCWSFGSSVVCRSPYCLCCRRQTGKYRIARLPLQPAIVIPVVGPGLNFNFSLISRFLVGTSRRCTSIFDCYILKSPS